MRKTDKMLNHPMYRWAEVLEDMTCVIVIEESPGKLAGFHAPGFKEACELALEYIKGATIQRQKRESGKAAQTT
jgi:hypothetical protein